MPPTFWPPAASPPKQSPPSPDWRLRLSSLEVLREGDGGVAAAVTGREPIECVKLGVAEMMVTEGESTFMCILYEVAVELEFRESGYLRAVHRVYYSAVPAFAGIALFYLCAQLCERFPFEHHLVGHIAQSLACLHPDEPADVVVVRGVMFATPVEYQFPFICDKSVLPK